MCPPQTCIWKISPCYEFVHSPCCIILYNYTNIYLTLLLLYVGFYVSSTGLLQRVVLRTFLYVSVGEHMWHFCRIDSLMSRPWVIGYECVQLSDIVCFPVSLSNYTLISVYDSSIYSMSSHTFLLFWTIWYNWIGNALWFYYSLITRASFNLFNGHLDFLFCEISSQVFACSFIRLSTFSLDLPEFFAGFNFAVNFHCVHAFWFCWCHLTKTYLILI